MAIYYLYNTLLLLASPWLGLYLLYRRLVSGKEKGTWRERRGLYEAPEGFFEPGKPVIWLHAVSVGEVVAAAPLAHAIKAALDCRLILSTVTPTGREMVAKRNLPADLVVYLPFDITWFVRRAFARLKPDALVLMESELWYNLVFLAHKRGIPIMLANGRISDRTLKRGARLKWYYRAIYRQLDAILMQSKVDLERALAFGAPPEKVAVGGNTKFEEPEPEVSPEEAAALKRQLGFAEGDLVLVCGSTREGEEARLLAAFEQILVAVPEARLLIAPRHLHRAPEVVQLCKTAGFEPLLRTEVQPGAVTSGRQIVLLDTLGELARVYAIARLAFLGGILINGGGQNLLQPLAQGKPPLTGPHFQNFRSLVELATEARVCYVVEDEQALAKSVIQLMKDEELLASFGARAKAFLAANKGASARAVAKLTELLGRSDG